jgi:inositol transport system substrate-binding protein
MKKILCLIVGLLMVTSMFAGCASTQPQTSASEQPTVAASQAPVDTATVQPTDGAPTDAEKMTIGFANVNDIYPYLVKVRTYVQQFGEEAGFEVQVANAAGDINAQIGQIETFETQGVNYVICVPADPEGIVPTVDELWTAGIPFLTVCGNSNGKEIHVGSLNYDAGVMQADYLADVLPQGGTVLYMHADPNQEEQDRRDGFMTLFEKRPDLKLLTEEDSQNRTDLGMSITETWIQMYDKFDAIVCQNDDSALGAIEALKAGDRLEGVIVVGLDGSDQALASIKAGELAATAFQDAEGQAKALIEICKQLRDGADPDTIESVSIPFKIITKDNVDSVM